MTRHYRPALVLQTHFWNRREIHHLFFTPPTHPWSLVIPLETITTPILLHITITSKTANYHSTTTTNNNITTTTTITDLSKITPRISRVNVYLQTGYCFSVCVCDACIFQYVLLSLSLFLAVSHSSKLFKMLFGTSRVSKISLISHVDVEFQLEFFLGSCHLVPFFSTWPVILVLFATTTPPCVCQLF